MKKIKVFIERSASGFSAYTENHDLNYDIIGTGKTVQETRKDFIDGYQDMIDSFALDEKPFEEAQFIFKYDMPSFLDYYSRAFTLAGLSRITGINQKQLGHYLSGYRNPSKRTVRKMEEGIQEFANELSQVRFI